MPQARNPQHQHCVPTTCPIRTSVVLLCLPLILISLPIIGCGGSSARKSPVSTNDQQAAQKQWQKARTAWLLDDVATAQISFSRFAELNPYDPRSGEALLTAGICAQRRGRKEEAEGLLREAQSRGGAIAARALLQRGYLILANQPQLASPRFGEAARLAEDVETRAEAWFQHGLSLQRSGRFEEALKPLRLCAQQNVAAGLAARARLQLQYDPWFTVQVGAFLERAHALNQLQLLEQAGLPAEIRSPGRKGSPLHRVLSGRFDRRDEAHRHCLRVRSATGNNEARIVP